jgi:murein DD-endopeptidase MepM/ murein hydrolase activator NlpD
MVKRLLPVFFVCLGLLIAAHGGAAQAAQTGTAAESANSVKTAKSVSTSKKATHKATEKSGVAGRTKKSPQKQQAKSSGKAGNVSKIKASKSRKFKNPRRDPDTLPVVHEEFAEAPHSVLAEISTIPVEGSISSYFGPRRLSARTKRVRMHTGVDIRAAQGTPVFAAAAGVVSFVAPWSGYGRIVEIDHGNGLITRYAHLDSYVIEAGAMVASGELIGTVGRTGRATGCHLHFETLVNGKHVDPMMAEVWAQAPDRYMAKRGIYVSGVRAARPAYQ